MSKLTKDNHEHSFIDSSNEAVGDECMYCGLLRSTIEPIMDKSQKIAKDWITKDPVPSEETGKIGGSSLRWPVPPKEDRPDKPIMSKYKEDQKLYSRPKEECTCHCHHKSCSAVSWKHIHATCEHCTPPVSEGKSFFDLPENEKREIVEKAAQDSNKAQQEFMESNTNLCQVCGKEADTYYIDMNDDSKEGSYCKEHMPQSNTHEWERLHDDFFDKFCHWNGYEYDLNWDADPYTILKWVDDKFEAQEAQYRGYIEDLEKIIKQRAADRQCIIQKVEEFDTGGMDTILKSDVLAILKENA